MGLGRMRSYITGLVFLLIFPGASHAGGPIQGAKAAAMGGAFLAVSDDPSAIAHNPAGLTNLKGTNLYGGVCAVILSRKYTSPNGDLEETAPQVFFPPNIFLTSDFGFNSLAFGLGIYSPFGIGGRKWSNTGLTRFASTENLIGTVEINPTFAWRVLPWLSLGVGLDILYSSTTTASMVDQSLLGVAPARLSFKGYGFGIGYNLGLLLFPGEKLSFAFAYRSAIRVNHEGTLALGRIAPPLQPFFGGGVFRTDANIVMTFPHKFSWGLAYRPTPKVTLALDLEWLWWSSFKQPTLDLKNEIPAARLSDSVIPFDWRNTLLLTVGWTIRSANAFLSGADTYSSRLTCPNILSALATRIQTYIISRWDSATGRGNG
jgi:long-chain fatty acid transport protein